MNYKKLLWILSVVFWCVVLFVGTCTESFRELYENHKIRLVFNHSPDFQVLLKTDIHFENHLYMIQKIGHFSGFFILALLATYFGKRVNALIFCVFYAFLTEILQLFFYRDGRLSDVVIDSSGVLAAFVLCLIVALVVNMSKSILEKRTV